MIRTLQWLTLAGFVLCAAFTALQQVQYGMICGRSAHEEKQEDPKAEACQKRSLCAAILAAAFLLAAIVLGAVSRLQG